MPNCFALGLKKLPECFSRKENYPSYTKIFFFQSVLLCLCRTINFSQVIIRVKEQHGVTY